MRERFERQWTVDRHDDEGYKHDTTRLLFLSVDATSDLNAEAARLWKDEPQDVTHSGEIVFGRVHRLSFMKNQRSTMFLVQAQNGSVAVFAEHDPVEFETTNHYFRELDGSSICPEPPLTQVTARRLHARTQGQSHDHSHDHKVVDEHCVGDGAALNLGAAHDAEFMVGVSKLLAILLTIISAVMGVGIRLMFPAIDSPQFFGYINTLSGGMFIAMACFHILPETLEHAPAVMLRMFTTKASYLSIMVWVMFGFLLALFFDRVFFGATGLGGAESIEDEEALKDVLNPKRNFIARSFNSKDGEAPGRRPIGEVAKALVNKLRGREARDVELSQSAEKAISSGAEAQGSAAVAAEDVEEQRERGHGHGHGSIDEHDDGGHGHGHGHGHGSSNGNGHGHGHHGHGHGVGTNFSNTGAIVLMCSLSFHSIFEGVLIGTADSVETVWVLIVIIAGHKWAEVLAIANTLTPEQRQGRLACILLSIFSLSSPLGTVLGWIVEELKDGDNSGWASQLECVLNALSVGSLFYIGFVEVIPEEFTGSKNSMKKFGLLLLGIVAMYFLTAFHVETAHGDFMPQHQ